MFCVILHLPKLQNTLIENSQFLSIDFFLINYSPSEQLIDVLLSDCHSVLPNWLSPPVLCILLLLLFLAAVLVVSVKSLPP